MKEVRFAGDSRQQLRKFPISARKEVGNQLFKLQQGFDPSDWKPMTTIGVGVREIRIHDEAGAFRIIYVLKKGDLIWVLHAFKKTSQQTAKRDIDLAMQRYRQI